MEKRRHAANKAELRKLIGHEVGLIYGNAQVMDKKVIARPYGA